MQVRVVQAFGDLWQTNQMTWGVLQAAMDWSVGIAASSMAVAFHLKAVL